jgi:hypothetical protein
VPAPAPAPPTELVAVLRRQGLVGDDVPPMTPLAGGVSSDIWRVDLPSGPVCVKRALATLKVAAAWHAPVERTAYEAAWMEVASCVWPGLCPSLLAYDAEGGSLVMTYLDARDHHLWKSQLRDGRTDAAVAAELGRRVGSMHAATADRPEVATRFDNLELFEALRLQPYLDTTARAHPDLAPALAEVRAAYLANRRVLLHGDVSPKNVLVGPEGPVLLDAECATWGDPAFDLAFCVTHLLLKCRWNPGATNGFLDCYDRLVVTYLGQVTWEPPGQVEQRAALLVGALLLGRVDGKSPVEYLDRANQEATRATARSLLQRPAPSMAGVRSRWAAGL